MCVTSAPRHLQSKKHATFGKHLSMISLVFGSSVRLQGWLNDLWRHPPLVKSSGASTPRLVRISTCVRKSHCFCSCGNIVQAVETYVCAWMTETVHMTRKGELKLQHATRCHSLPKMSRWTQNNTAGTGNLRWLPEWFEKRLTYRSASITTHWALVSWDCFAPEALATQKRPEA